MKRFSEQLQKKSNSLRLKAGEKLELRERLVSYMEYHPIAQTKKDKTVSTEVFVDTKMRFINIRGWKFLQFSSMAIATLLLVIPYVAEKAVPGDMLYAVKVNFNEEVRSTLTLDSYEKVVWETERLNRRIAEARLLANEGRMTEELEVSVAEAVRTHSENARKEIATLKETDEGGAVLASIQLDTTIDVQSTALRNGISSAISTEKNMTILIADVLTESQVIGDKEEIANLPSRERLVGQIESETTRVYELLANVKTLATTEEQSDIKRRLEDIDRKNQLAMQTYERSETEASNQLLEVLQDIQKLVVFMTNIDVRTNITIDEIVPVTLTTEERLTSVKDKQQKTLTLIEYTEQALEATSSPVEIKDKVSQTLKQSKSKMEELTQTLQTENFDLSSAELIVNDNYNLVKDSWTVLGVREADLLKKIEEDKLENIGTTTDSVIKEESTSTEAVIKDVSESNI